MTPPTPPLEFLTDLPAQTAAQAQLTTELRAAATWTGPRTLTSRRPKRTEEVAWFDSEQLWFATYDIHDTKFSNTFGFEDPRSKQTLPMRSWINPGKGATSQSSGAFVRDADGAIYLCHSGQLGGSKKGVGKHAFLDWLDPPRVQVDGRQLILVARLGSDTLVADLAAFVHATQEFKAQVGDATQTDDDGAPDEPWSLAAVLDDIDEAAHTPLLTWLADTIQQAHAVSPTCWAVTRRDGSKGPRLRLLIGRIAAFEIGRGRVAIGLNPATLPAPDAAQSDIQGKDFEYAELDDSILRKYTPGRFLELRDNLRPSAQRFVELAADAFRKTPFARYHAPALLHELGVILQTKLPRPAHAGDAPSYWRIIPGEQGRLWDECRDGGYIAIGWNELGDLSDSDRDDFDARLDAQLAKHAGWSRRSAEQAWRFVNIPVGARIVAADGTKRVLGIGTVTAPYQFVEDGREFAHHLSVDWDDLRERAFPMPGWTRAVIQMSAKKFGQILSAPSPGEEPPEEPPPEAKTEDRRDFRGLLDGLDELGLSFPDDLVASYLLALQAKRFVLLSGISGTGKTQLAIAIARAFQPTGASDADTDEHEPDLDSDARRLRVHPYMRKHRRMVVPAATLDSLTVDGPTRVTVHFGNDQTESLRLSPAGNAMQLMFKGDFRQWFNDALSLGDEFELSVESEDPPALRFSIPELSSAPPPIPERTYRVVAVRPDWTDNRGLLGYYNPITREYQPTPFLRLLLAADHEHRQSQRAGQPPLPFFAILDEMNLARVEHYFSDFLSCLESGEPIHLHDDPLVAAGASEDGLALPMHLSIPPNLFITGTVNVDETTYMFSPKVLDRAFVLEFNDVNLHELGVGPQDDAKDSPSPLTLRRFAGALDVRDKPRPSDYTAFREFVDGALHRALLGLNARLQTEHRHFGYRVANEIARFVALAHTQARKDPAILWDSLDVAVVAKVLPKLHGTQQELQEILERLLAFALDVEASEDARDTGAGWKIHAQQLQQLQQLVAQGPEPRPTPRLPRAAAKLWRMLRRLRKTGFVSFIE